MTSALVIGGGIVGLVAARALALRGVRVTLLERKPVIEDEAGIGIGLQNNALNALGEIGLAQAIVDGGVPVGLIHVYAPTGHRLGTRPTERYCGSLWPGYAGISRASLHAILVAGARDAGAELVTGAEVERLEERPDGVSVTLAGGGELTADMVVGCDGIYSTLRRQLFPEHAQPQPTGEAVWRGLVPGVDLDDISFVFGGPVGTIGYCALRGDVYLYAVDRDDRPPPRDAPDMAERMQALLAGAKGPPVELAARISRVPGDVTYRRLETVQLPAPWHRGRVILIGDAAHAGPPTLAQGAAMGIEDAVVLAQCVAAADKTDEAFAAFMARRHERVRTIVEASITIARAQMEPDGQAQVAAAGARAAAVLAEPY